MGENGLVYASGTEEGKAEVTADKAMDAEADGASPTTGNSMATATRIGIGTTYYGVMSDMNKADYYKFTIGSSGKITLTASAGIEYVYYCIYDEAGNELWKINPHWNSTTETISTSETIHLTKGTYYFAVLMDWRAGDYSFRLNFKSAGESFSEINGGSNNSLNKANPVSLDKEYKGQIAINDEKDFYRFTLPASGRISFSAAAGMEYIIYRIYDADGNQLWDSWLYWNSTTEQIRTDEAIDLTSGTYYLLVEKRQDCTGNYSFRLGYQSAGETWRETGSGSDNTMSSARSAALNTMYKGQLAINDEKDFYKFKMTSQGEVTLSAVAGMKCIWYRIYDEAGNELKRFNPYWNETTGKIVTKETLVLKPGTYYLVAERDEGRTGNYSFKLITHTHSYSNVVTKATTKKDGKIEKKCSCGKVLSSSPIYYPKTIKLSKTSFTYNGKSQRPSVTVKDRKGKTISSKYYTVSYRNNKNAGTATVTVTFKGNYKGTKTATYRIVPKSTSIQSVSARKKGFIVKWKKQSTQTSGYQIQYSTSSRFKGAKTKNAAGNKITTATVKNLKGSQKYYVRIRTYKKVKVNGEYKKVYSAWSKAKTVKTKR